MLRCRTHPLNIPCALEITFEIFLYHTNMFQSILNLLMTFFYFFLNNCPPILFIFLFNPSLSALNDCPFLHVPCKICLKLVNTMKKPLNPDKKGCIHSSRGLVFFFKTSQNLSSLFTVPNPHGFYNH
jgi:hypothetical protein